MTSEDQDSHLNLPELITKQQDLIQRLQRQLTTAERDAANEAWVRKQLMQSFSWRITSPVRLAALIVRSLASKLKPAGGVPQQPSVSPANAETSPSLTRNILAAIENLRAEFLKLDVDTFLSSQSVLEFPASSEPQVTVILKISHRPELAFASLSSLAREIKHGLELMILDGTESHDAAAVLARVRGAELIPNSENGTAFAAVNKAAMRARGKYILFLMSGAHLVPGSLDAALETANSAPDIGAVGGRIIRIDGSLQEAGSILWPDGSSTAYGDGDRPSAPMYAFRRDVDGCSTGFLLTPRAVFHRNAGFSQENDYCRRLTQSGMRVVYEPGATVLGQSSASSSLPRDPIQTLQARSANRQRRILFIEDRPPHRWLGTGLPRAHAILEKLLRKNFFVSFYPLIVFNEEWNEAYSDISREVEILLEYGPDLLEEFLSERRGYYEIILISRPHNMQVLFPIIEKHPDWFDNVTVIYDAEAVFATRDIARRKLAGAPMTEAEATATVKAEIKLAAAADLVISVSETERDTFVKNGIARVEVLGHSIKTQPSPNGFEDREGFLFVGAIKEASPNSDSVIWFVEEILPIIHAQLGRQLRVTIAGLCDSSRVRELASPAVRIAGVVDDLSDLYNQSRVFIAPTRYGAGIPHKVHEAAAHGLPTVVTPLLAEQLKWRDGYEIAVGSDARSFAEACIRIHETKQQWQDLRTNALARIETECSVDAFDRHLDDILRVVRSKPNAE